MLYSKTRRRRGALRAYFFWSFVFACLISAGCDSDGGSDGPADGHTTAGDGHGDILGDVSVEPVELDASAYTYTLTQSSAALGLWTTPATRKVRVGDQPPEATAYGLRLSAARREFEPAQLLLGPGSGAVAVSIDAFASLGMDARVELSLAEYEASGWPDRLTPLAQGGSVTLASDRSTSLWVSVYVPEGASAGEHTTQLTLTPAGGDAVMVPVTLEVFDFSLPPSASYATQINIGIQSLMTGDRSVDDVKTLLHGLRMTPKSVTWPSGFKWGITWENAASDAPCERFWDEPEEGDAYSIGALARRYILGEGWNGVGFPTTMIFQFIDNSTPRPESFCGISRGDHLGTAEYNAEWSQFLGAVEGYLTDNGMIEKAYYYVQNEPQDAADHALAAHLCRLSKAAAPTLKIAISEEPKPEIAEEAGGACGYDIWIAHLPALALDYSWARQRDHGEAVWIYSLDHDPDPYPNPTKIENQGMHQRVLPWVSWQIRAQGWAYYDAGRYFDADGQPTIRAALLREGFEDYEYLLLAAGGGAHPSAAPDHPLDPSVAGIATSATSWNNDPDALMALRYELGRFIEGSRDTLPVLEVGGDVRPRQPYQINFQDPSGAPSASPLSIDGEEFMKIGWGAYDAELGYGWSGENVGNDSITVYGYDEVDGYGEHQRSYLYDDYGRLSRFEFALPNGLYEVTVGVGRPRRGYPGDPHNVTLEGEKIVDDEATTDAAPTIERTTTIDLKDGSLSLEVGGRSQSSGDFAYTFLGYMKIAPIDAP